MSAAESLEHTFLFADLAGYAALTEAHGDEDAAEVASAFVERVRDVLPAMAPRRSSASAMR